MSGSLVLRNGAVLDVDGGSYREADIRIVDGRIVEIDRAVATGDGPDVDLRGGYVLPGLIDAHVHVMAATADLGLLRAWSPHYAAAHAAREMGRMLDRGFTTVRDTGGADFGLADAQGEGLIRGPRLLFCGKAISQTGGHGDERPRGALAVDPWAVGLSQLADGVDAVRVAARHELRRGANHLKVMASGGVASPTDRVDSTGYSDEELRAVVEEAQAANRYVAAHAYTARAVDRALRAGVRSIEHGNLIDEGSVRLLLEHDAFLVPNLVTYWALHELGRQHGLSEESWRKVADVLDGGYRSLELAARAGVQIAYGTDLLGDMRQYQSREFEIRADLQPAMDIIRSATTVGAQLVGMAGEIGCLAPGAFGDLIVLDADPLADVRVLAWPHRFRLVAQGGEIVRRAG
ncbi:MAG TPA: amidohydrolase family protein [Nakamurella sp.]|nr:amidohydrolase family protein [Nakamurella sp.]